MIKKYLAFAHGLNNQKEKRMINKKPIQVLIYVDEGKVFHKALVNSEQEVEIVVVDNDNGNTYRPEIYLPSSLTEITDSLFLADELVKSQKTMKK